MEMVVSSPSDSGSVVQLEGTVGCQLRKSCLTSGGRLTPKIAMIGGEEWSLSIMGMLVLCVADDFSYVCLDKGKRELVNVVDNSKHNAETSHAQRLKQ